MQLYVSTNLSGPKKWAPLFQVLEYFEEERLGLEILPLCHEENYFKELDSFEKQLRKVPVTFHEPYIGAEHSAAKGSLEYQKTMEYCRQMFEYAQKYHSSHVVFHLNNRPVPAHKKGEWLRTALENLEEIKTMAETYNQTLLVENTGVRQHNNVLLDEREFIDFFTKVDLDCLFDVGHAYCNQWNLEKVTSRLAGRIHGYHLHNNYRQGDDHNYICDGSMDPELFFTLYHRYTPDVPIVLEYRSDLLMDGHKLTEEVSYVCNHILQKTLPGL